MTPEEAIINEKVMIEIKLKMAAYERCGMKDSPEYKELESQYETFDAGSTPHRFVDIMDIDSRVEMREIFGFKARVPSILWKDEPQTLNEFKIKLMKGEYYDD
jgi:hypothetical protein